MEGRARAASSATSAISKQLVEQRRKVCGGGGGGGGGGMAALKGRQQPIAKHKRSNCKQKPMVQNCPQRKQRTVRNERQQRFPRKRFTRAVQSVVYGRLGHITSHIPGEYLQPLFNDMHLYPSKDQVSAMLQCAKKVNKRKEGKYLTLGEFCLFVKEMQKPKLKQHLLQVQQQAGHPHVKKSPESFEVFLGGSCNPTTWRTDTAIPELNKHGISFYNPQVSIWVPELVAKEHNAKQSANLLLFVLDNQTRNVVGMIEVAFLIASGRCVVLVANPFKEGQSIMDEDITSLEYHDLVHGQTSLIALVKSQGIKVHSNLSAALQRTANILRNTNGKSALRADDLVTEKLSKLREVFDSFDPNRSGEISLKSVLEAYERLTRNSIDMESLCEFLNINSKDANSMRISFEQFCLLVAEFSTDDGCDTFKTEEWLKRQPRAMNNNIPDVIIEHQEVKSGREPIDIYLAGSRRKNEWRKHLEPLLKSHKVTFYNPAESFSNNCPTTIETVSENVVLRWKRTLDRSRVLLFYITSDTRSLTSMILAAYYIGCDCNVVLCIEHLPDSEDLEIIGEKLTRTALKDYNRGRVYLHDLAKNKQVPLFENITDAVQAAIGIARK